MHGGRGQLLSKVQVKQATETEETTTTKKNVWHCHNKTIFCTLTITNNSKASKKKMNIEKEKTVPFSGLSIVIYLFVPTDQDFEINIPHTGSPFITYSFIV